jgi:hypothetical protein
MKKVLALFTCFFLLFILSSCASQNNLSATTTNSFTLAQLRQAAKDAGYETRDEYVDTMMKDIIGGFSVESTFSSKRTKVISILECRSEESAIKNCKIIDEAGYQKSIRNGKYLAFPNAKDPEIVFEVMSSIVNGSPIPLSKQ